MRSKHPPPCKELHAHVFLWNTKDSGKRHIIKVLRNEQSSPRSNISKCREGFSFVYAVDLKKNVLWKILRGRTLSLIRTCDRHVPTDAQTAGLPDCWFLFIFFSFLNWNMILIKLLLWKPSENSVDISLVYNHNIWKIYHPRVFKVSNVL